MRMTGIYLNNDSEESFCQLLLSLTESVMAFLVQNGEYFCIVGLLLTAHIRNLQPTGSCERVFSDSGPSSFESTSVGQIPFGSGKS